MPRLRQSRFSYEGWITLLACAAGLPGSLCALVLLWTGDFTPKVQWTLSVIISGCWLGFAFSLRERIVYPLQTISNLLGALREGDFSVRGRAPHPDDALGEVMREVNTLSATLREQRLGALEATTLLASVMKEIDVAVFAFDDAHKLRLINRAGERLLGAPAERLLGAPAADLQLSGCLEGEPRSTFQAVFPGVAGRFGLRRTTVREHGLPLQLLVISDLTQALREQELQAWQRLVRVLGHELNNSLTPIKSIAGTLGSMMSRPQLPDDWRDDMLRGLGVISARADSLSRFIGAYARLAKLPRPHVRPIALAEAVRRAVSLETRVTVAIEPSPDLTIMADPDQLEQVLINLLRNAADAVMETSGGVSVTWLRKGTAVEIAVYDEGPGLAATANLFVPFFTTKPGGSGIGLVLSRQIAEAHSGTLTLQNRDDRKGSVACLRLPLK